MNETRKDSAQCTRMPNWLGHASASLSHKTHLEMLLEDLKRFLEKGPHFLFDKSTSAMHFNLTLWTCKHHVAMGQNPGALVNTPNPLKKSLP